jgi:tellurite resistance protein
MWEPQDEKECAILRLKQVVRFATDDGALDQEEQDHLAEIIRLIEERVPAECFAGLGDFKGAD